MKTVKNIAFLLLISLFFSNLSAGKKYNFRYKGQDARQLRIDAIKAARHLQRISETRTARFESRHPSPLIQTNISSGKRAFFVFLMFMLLIPQVSATPIPQEDWPPTVHKISHQEWDVDKTFGPCEELPSGAKICCNIGENYTVTCYAEDLSRYVSFDIGGIIGDQPESNPTNMTALFAEAQEICAARPNAYHIANEARVLFEPKYSQNTNGTECSIETFESKNIVTAQTNSLQIEIEFNKHYCYPKLLEIDGEDIPTLVDMVKKFAKKFNSHNDVPKIEIYDNSRCGGNPLPIFLYDKTIGISYASLQEDSDRDFASHLGHEFMHLIQQKFNLMRNEDLTRDEVEADISSLLACVNPCNAVWFAGFADNVQLALPELTRENYNEVLKAQMGAPHPSVQARIALILTMYKHYKKARQLLMLTAEEQ